MLSPRWSPVGTLRTRTWVRGTASLRYLGTQITLLLLCQPNQESFGKFFRLVILQWHPVYIVAFRRRHLELLNLRGSTVLTGHYIPVGSLKYITFKVREKAAYIISGANKTWKVSPTHRLGAAYSSPLTLTFRSIYSQDCGNSFLVNAALEKC